MISKHFFAIVLLLSPYCTRNQEMPNTCDSDIFCYGEILETVQKAKLFGDSKTFVDMPMKCSIEDIKQGFETVKKENKQTSAVKKFLRDCFSEPGSEFEAFTPEDWKEKPSFLDEIDDSQLKDWAIKLHEIWKELGRKMKKSIETHQSKYSILYVPNPVVVPGGRFREYYYWDSYWIVLGLLHSQMATTVRGMLDNFLRTVKKNGLVPNGGRVYYLRRSQPPFLIPMMELYYNASGDKEFIESNIELLEKEFNFWMDNRCVEVTVDGKKFKLARYNAVSKGPRPESFNEDIEAAEKFKTESEKNEFFSELKSACESGWDFSSRWFITNGTNKGSLADIKIRSIIPVDLNAIIYWNAKILSNFHELLKSEEKANKFRKIADDWLDAVTSVLWNEEDGIWFDYDMKLKKQRRYYYASNFFPLMSECYPPNRKDEIGKKVVKYINNQNLLDYKGGIPTSVEESGEQWDYPNAWPPLQHMIIIGLDKTENKDAKDVAKEIASNWIKANWKGYSNTKAMFEKYDSADAGAYGGGGEYSVQMGFGWTNGVCLDLLRKYQIKIPQTKSSAITNSVFSISWKIIFILYYMVT